jgi:ATP-dependent exoDNAse (exonuclease V) alpha subunit
MKQSTALQILKQGENLFITGAAGTGKTYLLERFIEYVREDVGSDVSIVAPTGVVASNLGGDTIHSFFGIGIKETISDENLKKLLKRKYIVGRIRSLTTLIVDEISMVSPTLFETMDKILRYIKDPFQPFGGVQLILSGDFFQLPPISKNRDGKRFAWQSSVWRELELKTAYLQENFRQTDDKLIRILNDIRSGEVSEESRKTLNSRIDVELKHDFKPTRLYTHNIDVNRINSEELAKLRTPLKEFFAKSYGDQFSIEKMFKSSLLMRELQLKRGAVVIFIKNNKLKGYVNGTTGVVEDFTGEGLPIVKVATGETIVAEKEEWDITGDKKEKIATIKQIPLRLAWALTIHKSQGMTLDSAEIDLSKTFEVGQGYVALSRVRTIDGIRLIGINDLALQVDPLMLSIDERIKFASKRSEEEYLREIGSLF